MKILRSEFVCGVVATASVYSLIQDYMGREAYVKWASENWVSGWYTVPLAVFVLVFSIVQAVRFSNRNV